MALEYFTLIHILISLVGIAAGFGVVSGLVAGKIFPRWTNWFLANTLATSVTGFFFPYRGFTPAIAVGIVSLLVLALVGYALYSRHLAGRWRQTYIISALAALYLNVFVLIVQLFQKMPVLVELAATQTELPFAVTQFGALATFVGMSVAALKRSRLADG